jgi:hypothetical protein
VTARQDLNSGLLVRGTLELGMCMAPVPGGARTRTVPTSWLGVGRRYRRTAAAAERHTPARAAMGRAESRRRMEHHQRQAGLCHVHRSAVGLFCSPTTSEVVARARELIEYLAVMPRLATVNSGHPLI